MTSPTHREIGDAAGLAGGASALGSEHSARHIGESAELAGRLQRLRPALSRMAQDLVPGGYMDAALRRENVRLQAVLGQFGQEVRRARREA